MPTTTTSATTHPGEAGRLLAHLHQQGAAVSAEGDTLRVRAPRGAIDPDTAARIRQHKPALLALLRYEMPADAPAPDSQAIQEAIEERAAILEHDAGIARAQADAAAEQAIQAGVYLFRISDRPQAWLTTICPGCDLEEARHSLALRYGARLLQVIPNPYKPIRSTSPCLS